MGLAIFCKFFTIKVIPVTCCILIWSLTLQIMFVRSNLIGIIHLRKIPSSIEICCILGITIRLAVIVIFQIIRLLFITWRSNYLSVVIVISLAKQSTAILLNSFIAVGWADFIGRGATAPMTTVTINMLPTPACTLVRRVLLGCRGAVHGVMQLASCHFAVGMRRWHVLTIVLCDRCTWFGLFGFLEGIMMQVIELELFQYFAVTQFPFHFLS